MTQWAMEHRPAAEIAQIPVEELNRELSQIQVVDVRRQPEWDEGHVQGAKLMPLHKLESMLGELDHDRPIAVHCKGGYRSAIAASLIQRAGFENVMNVIGGFDAWRACGLPAV
jgi:hydroxyacylglutathione hydrolase